MKQCVHHLAATTLLFALSACHSPLATRPVEISFGTAQSWIETELFFGLTRRDGSLIDSARWQQFVDGVITPEFPDGFTVLTAQGQYLDSAGVLHKEPSRLVLLLYPQDAASQNEPRIRRIITAYIRDFDQEAILRTDRSQNASMVSRRESATRQD